MSTTLFQVVAEAEADVVPAAQVAQQHEAGDHQDCGHGELTE